MEKTQEILKHIFDLYSETERSESDMDIWRNKNGERYEAYSKAFEDYDMLDVFRAIDNYWRYTSNKTKPTVAKILAMLSTEKDVTKEKHSKVSGKYFSIENMYMKRDKELGINKEFYLPDYRRAVEYIIGQRLEETIGKIDYLHLQNDDKVVERSEKYKRALSDGLFNDFDAVLRTVNKKGDSSFGTLKDLTNSWRLGNDY